MITQSERVAIIVEEFSRCGITEFCTAPGSRNTPLLLAGLENDAINFRVFHDERSMAFFALGIARRGKSIPVVLTTSGTAVANLLPATIEADADAVPMILITADRPASQLGKGANQTIIQTDIFGAQTPTITIDEDLTGCELLDVISVVRQKLRDEPGPIHINLPLRKPLLEVADLSSTKMSPMLLAWYEHEEPWTTLDIMEKSVDGKSDLNDFDTIIVGANLMSARPAIKRIVHGFKGDTFFDIQSGSWTCGSRPLSAEVFGDAGAGKKLLILGHRFTEHRIWNWISNFEYVEQWKTAAGIFDPIDTIDKTIDVDWNELPLPLPQRETIVPHSGRGQEVSRIPEHLLTYARELRVGQTDAEKLIWHFVRKKNIANSKFRRQHPIGNYIVDFYCHEKRLVVELDGSQHLKEKEKSYDEKRTKFLNEQGIKVLRFDNVQVLTQTIPVLESVFSALNSTVEDQPKQVDQKNKKVGKDTKIKDRSEKLESPSLTLPQGERGLREPPLPLGEGWGGGDQPKQVGQKDKKVGKDTKIKDGREKLESLPQGERGFREPPLPLGEGWGGGDQPKQVGQKNKKIGKDTKIKDGPEKLKSPNSGGLNDRLSYSKLVSIIISKLEHFEIIHLANSLTIRAFDRFRNTGEFSSAASISFNRGASGIDGTLATGLGTAYDGSSTLIVCGDHAFLYDLPLLPDLHGFGIHATIIIVDNKGGRIFEHLPVSKNTALEKYFIASPKVELSVIISAFGFACEEVSTTAALIEKLDSTYNGIRFIVANVDPEFDLKDFSDRTKERFS